jgi:hypothetical protein
MDAYQPDYLYWEALDMLRKLALVGLVLCVGRGSVAQLTVAILLSFMFFALQMKTWPCKSEALVQQLVLFFFCDNSLPDHTDETDTASPLRQDRQ